MHFNDSDSTELLCSTSGSSDANSEKLSCWFSSKPEPLVLILTDSDQLQNQKLNVHFTPVLCHIVSEKTGIRPAHVNMDVTCNFVIFAPPVQLCCFIAKPNPFTCQ